jgi:hypothetical protein
MIKQLNGLRRQLSLNIKQSKVLRRQKRNDEHLKILRP